MFIKEAMFNSIWLTTSLVFPVAIGGAGDLRLAHHLSVCPIAVAVGGQVISDWLTTSLCAYRCGSGAGDLRCMCMCVCGDIKSHYC